MRFRIRDIYVPDPEELLLNIHGDHIVEGDVVDFSEGNVPGEYFALVEAVELNQRVLVPVKCLAEPKEASGE